jgi:hypothetical protein
MTLAEQIAVLDGFEMSPADGRIGQVRASVTQYATAVMPGVLSRKNVIDPSEGANYSGGSSYAPGLPLMPSTVGLAGVASGVLPPRRHVIDPSGGANYTGGSSYAPGMPLLPSSSGLAQADGYGRAGLGQSGYGAAGLGNSFGSYVDQDLAGAFNGLEALRALDPSDGRIGQVRASVTQYATAVMPGVLSRKNVIDPSEGANYSGGSSYAPGLPLMPSSVGLAGLDAIKDDAFLGRLAPNLRPAFRKTASKASLAAKLKAAVAASNKARTASTPNARVAAMKNAQVLASQIARIRRTRRNILSSATVNGVPVYATRPYSPSGLWK